MKMNSTVCSQVFRNPYHHGILNNWRRFFGVEKWRWCLPYFFLLFSPIWVKAKLNCTTISQWIFYNQFFIVFQWLANTSSVALRSSSSWGRPDVGLSCIQEQHCGHMTCHMIRSAHISDSASPLTFRPSFYF